MTVSNEVTKNELTGPNPSDESPTKFEDSNLLEEGVNKHIDVETGVTTTSNKILTQKFGIVMNDTREMKKIVSRGNDF